MESLIKLEADNLNAQIIVTGGLNNAEQTCPFKYKYIDRFDELLYELQQYDYILYHWIPAWAVYAVKLSGVPSVEFVHRIDTAECDKTVPKIILSHSQYICDYICETYGKKCMLVPNVVDTDYYLPCRKNSNIIGAVTSYYDTKGVDILIEAWSKIERDFPEYEFQIYGAGNQRDKYLSLAKRLKSNIKIYGPLSTSKLAYDKFQLVVSASRVEGLPIALLEALSCNLPIIASDIEGHRIINELAVKGGFPEPIRLFESENADELAQCIKDFICKPPAESTIMARETALALFSPKQHIQGILEAFYQIGLSPKSRVPVPIRHINCADYTCTLYRVQKRQALADICFPLEITNDGYLVVETSSIKNSQIILLDIDVELNEYSNISIQINWINGDIVSSECEGIYLDRGLKHLCAAKQLPVEPLTHIQITVRPNINEKIKVISVLLRSADLADVF